MLCCLPWGEKGKEPETVNGEREGEGGGEKQVVPRCAGGGEKRKEELIFWLA